MKFKSQFWDTKKSIIYIQTPVKGRYSYWRTFKDSNILVSILTGDEAKRVERLEKNKVMDEV